MIDVANAIAFNNAQAQGQSKYYKLSKEKIDEYSKSLQETNKQLTQLDKFATLSGNKSYQLGEWVSIDPNTEEGQKNIEEAKALQVEYHKIIIVLEKVGQVMDFILNLISNLGTESGKFGLSLLTSLLSFFSPLATIISLFISFQTLMSDAGIGAKALAGIIMTLTATFAALAVAKSFMINSAKGLTTAALIGASIGGVLAVVSGMAGEAMQNPAIKSYVNNATSNSSLASQLSTNTASNSSTNQTVVNLSIDGKKFATAVAQPMAEELRKNNYI